MKKIFSLLLAALFVSSQAYADKLTASTTLPSEGKPEHVYTMVNGNGAYAGPTTAPATDENGLFAFYAVEGVDGAYYIYSHSAKQWLGYTKAASYSSKKAFVTLSDSRVDGAYFKVDNYSGDNYQIQPYTTAGSAQAIYLNWYQGVSANAGTTLGLWTDNGATDAGSRYTLVEQVIAERTYTITVPEGVTLTIDGKEYANGSTITVEGSLDKSKVSVTAPEGKFAVVSVDDVNNTITVNVATLPVQADSDPYVNAWVYPKQQENVVYFREKMLAAGFDIKPTQSAICAVMLYDAKLSQDFANRMAEEGIYVTGFYYPVVPKDQARIRVQLSAAHSREDLDKAIAAFIKVGKELGVIK